MKRILGLGVALVLIRLVCGGDPVPLRVATFNIEDYPRGARQVEGAFAAIEQLHAAAIAVQEITEPRTFAADATRLLGRRWQFVVCQSCPRHRVGVLFDATRLSLVSTREYDTRAGKPALETRFRPRAGGAVLRIITVHLKAGGDGEDRRAVQLETLTPIVADAVASGERVVLLGDFNATGEPDRARIGALAQAARMQWATRELRCTSYWDRTDGCRGTALDHILVSGHSRDVAARGPCEEIGCDPGERCPTFVHEVSDHCPVSAVLD